MGFDGKCKLHAYEIESRNETEYKIPRMDFICITTHFEWTRILKASDSVLNFPPKWFMTSTTNSTRTKSSDKVKLSAEHIEWTSRVP